MQSGLALTRLHTTQSKGSAVACGRSPKVVASCATMPWQTVTHSSQINADEPAMSRRTALCGLLQNEQRCSRLFRTGNNERSRFTHMARPPGPLQTYIRLAPPTVAQDGYQVGSGLVYVHIPSQPVIPKNPQPKSVKLQLVR